MSIGHKLGLRLFLEGVEVPVIGATITVAANSPASCSLQVIATDKVLELLPRTLVHLFFYDFVMGESATGTDIQEDIENSAYKLLFVGEVQGLAFQKSAGSRAVMLNCVDLSNYWDTTYQYNFKGSLLSGRRYAAFIGANSNYFEGPLGKGVGSIAALLNGRSVNFPELKGLLAGIVRVLETIGGAYYGDTTFRGVTDFAAIAELRLKILQQICAAAADDSTAKLFARKTFNRWMNRQMGGLGKLVTFRGLTQLLQKFIFHDIYPCPVPKYVPREEGLSKTKMVSIELANDPKSRKFIDKIKKLKVLMDSALKHLTDYPSTGGRPSFKFVGSSVAIAPYSVDDLVRGLDMDLASCGSSMRIISNSIPNIPGLSSDVFAIDKDLVAVDKHIGKGSYTVPGFGLALNRQRLGMKQHRQAAIKALRHALATCANILGTSVKRSRTTTYDKLDRVNNQILRPDIWFAAPPRCNVIFPELYSSFSWSRNFLREVSRLELQTTHELLGDDTLFNKRYYSPDVQDMRNGLKLSSRKFGRLILHHELMTGIIPMFEKMTEANIYSMKGRKTKHKGAAVSYAQRAVNFQYFKHRFASRQMQCAGRFNPWFAPGFPGLIIDRPMSADKLLIAGLSLEEQLNALDIAPATGVEITRGTILRELTPTQFLGCCVQLTHSINQQGGNTSYAFGQARIHRESTEYMGVDKADVSKRVGSAKRHTPVAALPFNAPKEKKRGPRGGPIVGVADVTKQYLGSFLPVYGESSGSSEVKVGSSIEYYNAGETSYAAESYRAYRVTETYSRRSRVKVDLPIEDAIRPPWIWDGYTNIRVGDTYMQFFGTNSVTDIEGYTSNELLKSYAGADSYEASREAQEAATYGAKKNEDGKGMHWERTATDKEQDKPRKNKSGGKASQEEEVFKKINANTLLAMETDRTIESSVDYLVRVYSFIKYYSLDTGDFLRNYTWRPVATLPEIMGSVKFDLIDASKNAQNPPNPQDFDPYESGDDSDLFDPTPTKTEEDLVVVGKEGFHSRAFGDKSDLFGLVNPEVRNILGLSKEKNPATAERMDVRGIKREVVWAYVQELTESKGLLG